MAGTRQTNSIYSITEPAFQTRVAKISFLRRARRVRQRFSSASKHIGARFGRQSKDSARKARRARHREPASRPVSRLDRDIPVSSVPERLLASNEVPTHKDIALVNQYLEEMEELRQSGSAPNSTPGDAPRQRGKNFIEKTNKIIETHKAVISVLRSLPIEILQHIFSYAIPTVFNDRGKQRATIYALPVQQAAVCQLWRRAALSEPALWTRLPCINVDWATSESKDYIVWLRHLMTLSGSLLLDVRISSRWRTISPSHPALNVLLVHAHRWRSLKLQIPGTLLHGLGSALTRLPTLEEMVVVLPRRLEHTPPKAPKYIPFLVVTPHLRRVIVDGNYIAFGPPVSTTAEDYTCDIDMLPRVFHPFERPGQHTSPELSTVSIASTLRVLTLRSMQTDQPLPTREPFTAGFELPVLQELRIEISVAAEEGYIVRALNHLKAPALESISLQSHYEVQRMFILPALSSLLSLSGATLRHFTVCTDGYVPLEPPMFHEALIAFLRAVSTTLETLVVTPIAYEGLECFANLLVSSQTDPQPFTFPALRIVSGRSDFDWVVEHRQQDGDIFATDINNIVARIDSAREVAAPLLRGVELWDQIKAANVWRSEDVEWMQWRVHQLRGDMEGWSKALDAMEDKGAFDKVSPKTTKAYELRFALCRGRDLLCPHVKKGCTKWHDVMSGQDTDTLQKYLNDLETLEVDAQTLLVSLY